MIDDLVTKGTNEPYRMFTSRAEYRLKLRADNADQRLSPLGEELACMGRDRIAQWHGKRDALAAARAIGGALTATPAELAKHGFEVPQDGKRRTLAEILTLPHMRIAELRAIWPSLAAMAPEIAEQLETDAQYHYYLARQEADIEAYRRDEALEIPVDLDYGAVGSLSAEVRQKLEAAQPPTLGAAARISGVTPAAVIALLRHVKRSDGSRLT